MKNYPTTWVIVATATARWTMAAAAAAVIGLLPVHALHAEQVLVAVAANFSAPMAELAQRFSGQTGHEVVLTQGASGRFVAQISNGAPFQVFLSADQDKPRALDELGLTVPDTQFTYAVGALLLWSAPTRNEFWIARTPCWTLECAVLPWPIPDWRPMAALQWKP